MKKLLASAAIGIAAGFVLTTQVAGPLLAQDVEDEKTTYEYLDLFGDIFDRVRSSYVEEVNDAELIEAAISGMLQSLDPHSHYFTPEAAKDMSVKNKGEFGGLGIEVTQENGFVKVVAPMDDTPAAKAGIQAGDYITHIDGEQTLGLSLDQAVELMRGPVGADILITIARDGEEEPFDLTITRDTIKLTAVRSRVERETVVLRISTFSGQAYRDLEGAIRKHISEAGGIDSVSGFVLDLRNNPGGLLTQAIAISDAFLEKGEIVSTRGRDPDETSRASARPGDLAQGKPIVVLVNGGSASASEIVAGALQDHRRAVIIGTRTFGKGSVQTVIPLATEGSISMTTALYYTPSGRSIQALGISPDIVVEQRPAVETSDEEEDERSVFFNQRFESDYRDSLGNDSMSEDEIKQLEEERAAQEEAAKLRDTDYQLSYAIDILKGLNALQDE